MECITPDECAHEITNKPSASKPISTQIVQEHDRHDVKSISVIIPEIDDCDSAASTMDMQDRLRKSYASNISEVYLPSNMHIMYLFKSNN
jgi:hypothetical protein